MAIEKVNEVIQESIDKLTKERDEIDTQINALQAMIGGEVAAPKRRGRKPGRPAGTGRRGRPPKAAKGKPGRKPGVKAKNGRQFSKKDRQAISIRMSKFWAKRRKEKNAKVKAKSKNSAPKRTPRKNAAATVATQAAAAA